MRIAIRKPSPSSPSRFAAGTRQPSNVSSPVVEPRDAHLRLEPRDREARRVGLDDEGGDAAVARVRIGLREDGVEVRDAGVRDEALRAVEDVLVALAPRRRPHRGRVGAGAGLGQRVRGQPLARGEPRQVALLLLVAAGELEAERAELLHREDQGRGRADLRHLLDRDQREERTGAEPAVLLGEEEAEDVVLADRARRCPRGTRVRRRSRRRAARSARARAAGRGRAAPAARRSGCPRAWPEIVRDPSQGLTLPSRPTVGPEAQRFPTQLPQVIAVAVVVLTPRSS